MNIIAFPVSSTNIFPIANSVTGGQLLTEFNMRSRESVATDSEVKYMIGPSYTHAMEDFEVTAQVDASGAVINNSVIQIAPGRAVVNGHFVESLAPILIDMTEANYRLNKDGLPVLTGELSIGFRIMYSTKKTIAGSMLSENEDDYFEGVHVVILPKDEFKLPKDVPGDESKVTAHLLLATFSYINGRLSNISQNSDKIKLYPADRISNIENIVADGFLSANGLDPTKVYVLSGAGSSGDKNLPTWQNASNSLVQWEAHSELADLPEGSDWRDYRSREASFIYDSLSDNVKLVLPHLQNAFYNIQDEYGRSKYYRDIELPIPNADFDTGRGGVVTSDYTRRIKVIDDKINNLYHMPGGCLRKFIEMLNDRDELPPLPVYDDNPTVYDLEAFNYNINNLQSKIANLQSDIANFKNSVNSQIQDTANQIINEKIVNVSSSLTSLSSEFTAFQSSVNSQVSSLDNRVTILEGKDDSSDSLEPRIHALESRMNDVDSSIAQLSSEVTRLGDEYSSISSGLSSLQLLVSDIESRFQSAVSSYKDELLASLNERVSSVKSELLSAVEARMSRLAEKFKLSDAWKPGDYVLVGQDRTVDTVSDGRSPSTMYVILPGYIASVSDGGTTSTVLDTSSPTYEEDLAYYKRIVPSSFYSGSLIAEYDVSETDYDSVNKDNLSQYIKFTSYRGSNGKDYFVIRSYKSDDAGVQTIRSKFFTPVSSATEMSWSEPIYITGGVPVATETAVGGFLNVPSDQYGNGYVYRDDNGYLRLLDYDLLATGVLAYQLGEDFTSPAGSTYEDIQANLDDYVNSRVAFPNVRQISNKSGTGEDADIIVVTLNLPASEEKVNLLIANIDSRFGTSVHLKLVGDANENTTITIQNCERIRITTQLTGNPTIYLYNSCLYYDAETINRLTHIEGLSLWYKRYSSTDPNILVDGMTVEIDDIPSPSNVEDYWSEIQYSDNTYKYALKSITLSSEGNIIRCGLLVTDDITHEDTDDGKYLFSSKFKLPQGYGLTYPTKSLTKPLKVTGSFVTMYLPGGSDPQYVVKDTNFTALTNTYDGTSDDSSTITGSIAFYTQVSHVKRMDGNIVPTSGTTTDETYVQVMDAWASGKYHVFYGGSCV